MQVVRKSLVIHGLLVISLFIYINIWAPICQTSSSRQMGFLRSCLLVLFITFFLQVHTSTCAEARVLPFMDTQRYVKVLESLGIVCKCCDGAGGECSSTWSTSCKKFDCGPWKSY